MSTHSYPRTTTSKSRLESSPFAREVYRAEAARDPREDLLEEIAALRAEVRTEVRALRGAMGRPKQQSAELTSELAALRAAVDELLAAPGKKGDAFAALVRDVGVEGAAAAALARLGKDKAKGKARSAHERLAAAVASLVTTTTWPIACEGPTLVALVGPAGVGKTTTAAKLGARARRAKKTVAFVSCDGYRVGAIDQLRRYAELMECEFHAVTSPDELIAVTSRITADVIIVDTSGRAPEAGSVESVLGDDRLRGAAGTSPTGRRIEVMLCVAAALRAADASRIARAFAPTLPTSVCVTKLDETDAPSALVHAAFAAKLPISTVCFGQRVPEDIASATTADVVARLVPAAPASDDADGEVGASPGR